MERSICDVCGVMKPKGEMREESICIKCASILPKSLIKSFYDNFNYACGLRDGTIIKFGSAEINGLFVTLYPVLYDECEGDYPFVPGFYGYPFPRGIDVRLDNIMWCADAPEGS